MPTFKPVPMFGRSLGYPKVHKYPFTEYKSLDNVLMFANGLMCKKYISDGTTVQVGNYKIPSVVSLLIRNEDKNKTVQQILTQYDVRSFLPVPAIAKSPETTS